MRRRCSGSPASSFMSVCKASRLHFRRKSAYGSLRWNVRTYLSKTAHLPTLCTCESCLSAWRERRSAAAITGSRRIISSSSS